MAGFGCFKSNIGEDGVKRWKYDGPQIEIVNIPIVGGIFDNFEYNVGKCFLDDDYILKLDGEDGCAYIYGYDKDMNSMIYIEREEEFKNGKD